MAFAIHGLVCNPIGNFLSIVMKIQSNVEILLSTPREIMNFKIL